MCSKSTPMSCTDPLSPNSALEFFESPMESTYNSEESCNSGVESLKRSCVSGIESSEESSDSDIESTNNSKESSDSLPPSIALMEFLKSRLESIDNLEESCNFDTNDAEESFDSDYDVEEESKKILQEMETIFREVRESKFYSELKKQIESEEFQSQLTRVLASASPEVVMVIYALGNLNERNSKYQLAVALLLHQDLFNWITVIEVYDPAHSPIDIIALEKLGCTVLEENEFCQRRVERPTLFYMPYVANCLLGNLLEANWFHSNINQVILLTNKMSTSLEDYRLTLQEGETWSRQKMGLTRRLEYLEAIQKCVEYINMNGNFTDLDDLEEVTDNVLLHDNFYSLPFMRQMRYLEAIQEYTQEIGIRDLGELYDFFLYNFAFHFFNVASEIDLRTKLQAEEETQQQFDMQFGILRKKEEEQTVAIIEELITEAWNDQMGALENNW